MRIDFSPIRFFIDNTTLNTGSGGDVIASDDISGVKYQRVKLVEGADGVNDGDISSANPLPVTDAAAETSLASIDGKLTNPLPVSVSGGATSAKQDLQTALLTTIDGDTSNLDVQLSTRLKPADTLAGVTAVGSITNALPAGNNNIGDVDIASSALPTNAAQETGGNLANIAASASVMDDWDETDRAKVNPIVGQAGVDGNSGNKSDKTLRTVLATDQPALTTAGLISVKIDQTTDGTTNKVRATATLKPSYGSNVAMTITNLSALASSATAGWQSARVSNLSTLATDYLISVKATMANSAPANDKAIYVYALPWYTNDGGSTWFTPAGGTTTLPSGSEGTYTIASPNDFRLLGVLNYTTQNMVCQNNFLLSNAFGNRIPHGWSLVIINFTGAALATTSGSNNLVEHAPMNDVLV